ncbi:L-threonylcarbamoyladenylate synthase [Cryobacterium roopkundense]|uniref:L-threonylcarbamoyladenylate synthase n=1 Tax=Cryobacterium roopkundense TaxID=1001240 RepID=A0A7W9E242_9MICO|nr:L-threonylcarbamoyladenylate synthase [Cryobacterium roopkundense]MBB5640192.1 tRNA threonylcarbamoyl adenosine modification protein (Sua5/YciO/YrdC/YwlC family) [Cryobacterium roopkundense]
MTRIYNCSVEADYAAGMRMALSAIGRSALVVIPTDTVYGIAADAFSPGAVQNLLDAKGRDRTSPPPVLIPGVSTMDALAIDIPQPVRDLVAEFWPGGLTVILNAQPSLVWDLGETRGTVALRMPSNPVALDILKETGPLAVSSANLSGQPAAVDAQAAEAALGDKVAVYLDGGVSGEGAASTIVDATAFESNGGMLHIVRHGVISRAAIEAVIGEALEPEPGPPAAPSPEPSLDAETAAAPAPDVDSNGRD